MEKQYNCTENNRPKELKKLRIPDLVDLYMRFEKADGAYYQLTNS